MKPFDLETPSQPGAFLWIVISLFLAFSLAQEIPRFQASSTQVRVEASVLDQHNKHLAGLTAGDFALFDNGAQQPILHLDSDAMPLDLVLLVDVSPSMLHQLKTAAAAAKVAVAELREGDRVAVHTFCRKHREFLPLSEAKDTFLQAPADADATLHAVIYSRRAKLGSHSRLAADARPMVEQSGGDWIVARDPSVAFRSIL